jgi:L-seryl-tRNA(Ser) seleniumtransferase
MAHDRFRDLPAMTRVLAHPRIEHLLSQFSHEYVVRGCRDILGELRAAIAAGDTIEPAALEPDRIVAALESRIRGEGEGGLQRVVNATGTVLHTNFGRALLPRQAIDAVCQAAGDPVTLEYDLVRGERGRREQAIEKLVVELTGAEAATVVNNNAAAVLLALHTIASGKEVIVSRGELIEIGGAFRIPEIMEGSGAILREVGTTNRTHPADYEGAINNRTGLILKVHTSNYRIVGFVAEVGLPELVAIGRARGIPVMEDLGSGALVDLSQYGLPKEPVVSERVAIGADIVTFSGDKVLGGPQAGFVAGRSAWIESIARNPLHRAVRCGKLTIAALEATLRIYRTSAHLERDIPTLNALTRPLAEIDDTARRVLPLLQQALGPEFRLSVEDGSSQIGSGALPTDEIPSRVIVVEHDRLDAGRIAQRFRRARPPIIGRVRDDRFLLDVRTVFEPDDLVPRWSGEGPPE